MPAAPAYFRVLVQHLSSFNAGYRRVRVKLVVALTSDNALGLTELDVALCPVVADISQLGIVALISRVVDLVVAYNEDHFGHFRTGNDLVRLVRTIGVTGDYAQRRKHVHSVSSLSVSRIRERCTSKHGECASKRQYQCKNLFEIRVKIQKLWYNSWIWNIFVDLLNYFRLYIFSFKHHYMDTTSNFRTAASKFNLDRLNKNQIINFTNYIIRLSVFRVQISIYCIFS